MIIDKIIRNLLIRFPLFGNVITNIKFSFTSSLVPAPAYTDGRCIYYQQEFLDEYTLEEQEFIIAHEIMHIILKHMFRNKGKDQDLLNYVADAIINQMLIQCGMTMPDGCVDVPDALDYSVEELYMKYLPKIDEIKEWMGANTYHMEIMDLEAAIEAQIEEIYKHDLAELMDENSIIRDSLLDDFKQQMQVNTEEAKISLGLHFPSVKVGKSMPLLPWEKILADSLITPEETVTSFYEVEKDGVIRKEEKPQESEKECEILIDSSGSMEMSKIKAILRECKNILSSSHIKVGFFDVEFYGWHEIFTEDDIDKLEIVGRGGNDFEKMAKSFSNNVDNKIIITDGVWIYPDESPGVLWIIFNKKGPENFDPDFKKKKVDYIFIDEKNIKVESLKKKRLKYKAS